MVDNHQNDQPASPGRGAGGDEQFDHAAKSLADALRISFKLLTLVMIIVVAAFALSGFSCVESHQKGILKRFGKNVGVADQGLAYVWPYPVGEVEKVNTNEQELTIDDFWMHETPEDKTKDLSSRTVSGEGLRPGWDGALLTGDRNLLHVKLTCSYAVADALAFKMHVRENYTFKDPQTGKVRQIDPKAEMIRAVMCRAAIRAAAGKTADSIKRDRRQFANAVKVLAQRQLDLLLEAEPAGPHKMEITKVILEGEGATWPLRALPAYNAAQNARSEAEKLKNAAYRDAQDLLSGAAGPAYTQLVGELLPNPDRQQDQDKPCNLIGEYSDARSRGDTQAAASLLKEIDDVLISNTIGGQASRIIAEARSYQTAVRQRVAGRAERFEKLLPEFRKNPYFMMHRLWSAVRDKILSAPTNEKHYLTFGGPPTVVRISDPDIAMEIRRELLKLSQEKRAEKEK